MNKFSLLMMMVVTPVILSAQDKQVMAVESATKSLVGLLENPTEKDLLAILSADLVYGHSSGKIDTRASLIQSLMSGESDFVKIDISNQKIHKTSKSVFAVTHQLNAVTNNSGNPGEVKLFILLIWEKVKGKFQLMARQATRIT